MNGSEPLVAACAAHHDDRARLQSGPIDEPLLGCAVVHAEAGGVVLLVSVGTLCLPLRDLRLLGVAAVAQQRDDLLAGSEIRVALANLGTNTADFVVGQIGNGGFVWDCPRSAACPERRCPRRGRRSVRAPTAKAARLDP